MVMGLNKEGPSPTQSNPATPTQRTFFYEIAKIRMVCFFGVFDHFCSIEDRARAWRARFGSFWSKWSKSVHFRSFGAFRRARQGGVCSKIVERVLKKFFRLSARSSNTHQRGLIWSAIFTPLNFAAHSQEAPNFISVRDNTFWPLLTSRKLVSIAVQ